MVKTYKEAGVDIQKAGVFKKRIAELVKSSCGPQVLKGLGGFGSLFSFAKDKYKDPVLVSSADGVGTKLKIAMLAGRHDTIGIDAVAMNVNDILCVGARPLFFLDYISCSKLSPPVLYAVVRGLNAGCLQAGCALVGGETAEMPGMYAAGEYDLAGFCVGVVERNKIIDGSRIRKGDLIIGLASSGIHSNGYSLVRKIFSLKEQGRLAYELLRPTRIYVQPVLNLLRTTSHDSRITVSGISHITGGAFYDKIARVLPKDIDAVIGRDSWPVPQIFRLMQDKGRVNDREMYHTFNMGIGMALFVRPELAAGVQKALFRQGLPNWIIGEAVRGSKRTVII